MIESYIPQEYQEIIARLRARSKSGNQPGAEKPSQPVDGPVAFDQASDTALGDNTPIRVKIEGPKAGLKMTVWNDRDRKFVHRFLREIGR